MRPKPKTKAKASSVVVRPAFSGNKLQRHILVPFSMERKIERALRALSVLLEAPPAYIMHTALRQLFLREWGVDLDRLHRHATADEIIGALKRGWIRLDNERREKERQRKEQQHKSTRVRLRRD